MKLSAVAAFFAPPHPVTGPAKATDTSAVGRPATERETTIQDTLDLSPEALEQLQLAELPNGTSAQAPPIAGQNAASEPDGGSITSPPNGRSVEDGAAEDSADGAPEALSEEQQQQVTELKQRDAEVRAHEQAHVAAGGQYVTGGPTYEYQEGPDGRSYAVGGEVQIDTSPVEGDPEATMRKAQVVRAAALAPAEPSSQDLAVAAAAAQMALQAQADLRGSSEASESTGAEASPARGNASGDDAVGGPSSASQDAAQQTRTNAVAPELDTPVAPLLDIYV